MIGYYFHGKEGLLAEVYTRHCEPLKRERARLLASYRHGGRQATFEEILDAFIRPSLLAGHEVDKGKNFSRLRAILSAENSSLLEQLIADDFDDTSRSFVDAFWDRLPDLSKEDVF